MKVTKEQMKAIMPKKAKAVIHLNVFIGWCFFKMSSIFILSISEDPHPKPQTVCIFGITVLSLLSPNIVKRLNR